MSVIPQASFARVFERIGGAFSGLKRYADAAELIGSTSYFLFRQRDEFDFFPVPLTAFEKITGLLRDKGYDGADDVLKFEITDTGGVSFSLLVKETFGGTTLATATGTYGEQTLVPSVAFGPSGKITVTAPTGSPPAGQEVEYRVVTSAVRVTNDPTGETEEEQLVEAAALESHQIVASNFRNALLTASRDRIIIERLLQNFVGNAFLGTNTTDIFVENQAQDSDGVVTARPTGIIPELDTQMRINTPAQTVEEIVATIAAAVFDSVVVPATLPGAITITERQPTAGTLELKCVTGFPGGSTPDPEEFTAEFRSTTLDRRLIGVQRLRVFKPYTWPIGGFDIQIDRKTDNNDPTTRMSAEKLTRATSSNIPLERYQIRTSISLTTSSFEVIEPQTGFILKTVIGPVLNADPLGAGTFDFFLATGARLQFTWNGVVAPGIVTFDLFIRPYRVGDLFTSSVTIAGGRLQVELRRQFDFALTQRSATPTIPDDVVAVDLPFITPFLGA